MNPCPLIFEPILKPKIWGGRNLARLLGKRLPAEGSFGESWECADLPSGQSVVARGPAKGKTLSSLVHEWGKGLLGCSQPIGGRFPLLVKFLDAADNLSIQVHPPEAPAGHVGKDFRPKHEAWYVLEARDDAAIYRDLRPGLTPAAFADALRAEPRAASELVHRIAVRTGDTFFIPAGMVHAVGAGVVLAEIQTPSDLTYRIYDWQRRRPAEDAGLDAELGLASVRADLDTSSWEKRSHVTSVFTTVTRLVSCPSFNMERVRFVGEIEQEIPYSEPVCWVMLEGRGEILYGKGVEAFSAGEVIILPAGLDRPRLRTLAECDWLEVTLPATSDLAEFPRPSSNALQPAPSQGGEPISLNIMSRAAKRGES